VKELIRKILKEEVGVPNNIVNVANQIYNQVINNIDDDETVGDIDSVETNINGKFQIGDLKFKNIEYIFDFKENTINDEIGIAGMATGGGFKVTKKFKIKSTIDNNVFHIKFVMVAPFSATGKEIKEYIKQEKVEFISSITHELKHKYDDYKKPKTSLTDRGEYIAYTNNGFGDITPINKFFHHLYFTHNIENLVRPSELAGAIEAGEITKKGFYEFLTNGRVFKELKQIQNFTYEGLRDSLKDYISNIKELFDINDIDYKGLTDDELIDKTLGLVLLNVQQWKAESVHRLLMTNPIEMLLGFRGDKDKFFNDYINQASKFKKDFKKYFEYEEKVFKFVATKMIKKISKVYAMTKDDTNESIINWELWQKVNGSKNEIVTEFTYLKESDGRLPQTHPMIKAITKVVGNAGVFEDSYSMPYSDNDDMVDYRIEYHIKKISLWEEEDGEFSGTIKLIIDRIILGEANGDDWTRVYYRDDLPSWSWDRMEEEILSKVEQWIPNVGLDFDLIFPGYQG
jgi:hypothetical protein